MDVRIGFMVTSGVGTGGSFLTGCGGFSFASLGGGVICPVLPGQASSEM